MEPTEQTFLDHGGGERFGCCPFTLGKAKRTASETPHWTVISPNTLSALLCLSSFLDLLVRLELIRALELFIATCVNYNE